MNKFKRKIPKILSTEAKGNSRYKYVHYFSEAISFLDFCHILLSDSDYSYRDERDCAYIIVWLLENDLIEVVNG